MGRWLCGRVHVPTSIFHPTMVLIDQHARLAPVPEWSLTRLNLGQ